VREREPPKLPESHRPDDAAIVPSQLPEPTGGEVDTGGVEGLIEAVQQMDFTQTNLPDPIDQETGVSQLLLVPEAVDDKSSAV